MTAWLTFRTFPVLPFAIGFLRKLHSCHWEQSTKGWEWLQGCAQTSDYGTEICSRSLPTQATLWVYEFHCRKKNKPKTQCGSNLKVQMSLLSCWTKKSHIVCHDTHLSLKWDLEWDFQIKISPLYLLILKVNLSHSCRMHILSWMAQFKVERVNTHDSTF